MTGCDDLDTYEVILVSKVTRKYRVEARDGDTASDKAKWEYMHKGACIRVEEQPDVESIRLVVEEGTR